MANQYAYIPETPPSTAFLEQTGLDIKKVRSLPLLKDTLLKERCKMKRNIVSLYDGARSPVTWTVSRDSNELSSP